MGAEAWRADLDRFCDQELDVEDLALKNPKCACEGAQSPSGSPGPVKNAERVRLFLVSTSDIRGQQRVQREQRPFKVQSLKRALTTGLSVVRLSQASAEEIEYSASLLYDFQSERDPEHGGLLSAIDFPVSIVRMEINDLGSMCVFETPCEPQEDGSFRRPSHADIVNSVHGMVEEAKKVKLEILRNRIQKHGNQRHVEDMTDCNLVPFLPKIVKDESGAP